MQVIIIESVEALAIQIERELIKHSCDAPVVDSIISCLHPIEVPSGVEELVRVLEDGFYNASNEFGDLQIEKYRTKAAALIESYSRRVPMKMLTEIFNNAVDWVPIGDSERVDEIAAKYGVKVEG